MVARELVGCGDPSGQHHFAHHESRVGFCGVGVNGDRFQQAVRAVAFGLARRTAVKAPHRKFVEFWKLIEFFDLGFAAEVRDGFVAVEPDVFQFVFRHVWVVDFVGL